MTFGFALRRIALVGPGKEAAEVTFTRGLNVIAGPSDTGKSFIAQCLDFALGGGTVPKEIPQAEGYSLVVLEIEANSDHRTYVLERSLRGGDVRCKTVGMPDRILAAKHKAGKPDTISQFLLNLSGLGSQMVRTNEQGKTRQLSFRDIAPLVIIDEETVIKEDSPVLSGQVIHKTVESGVFRLLLTGNDDSSIMAKEDPKIVKGRQAGKVELLKSLLNAIKVRLAELGDVKTLAEERDRLSRIEESIQKALVERDAALASVTPVQAKRNYALGKLRTVESKLAVASELQKRFSMLREQYRSDMRRLDAIAEAGFRLGQLKEERCPMCGALAEYHDHRNHDPIAAPAEVSRACKAEAQKTQQLLHDLQNTLSTNTAEVEQLTSLCATHQHELDALSSELKELMERHVDVASRKVDDLRARAEICRIAIEQLERMDELDELLREAIKPKPKQRADVAGAAVSTAQADPFSRVVEEILKAWHFPNLDRVSFSENDQDVVVSGLARKSHGKGVRAIIRAAFNLALLRLCIEGGHPFPNFVLIDSPLLVYEEPDVDELQFPQDIKTLFWKSVKSMFTDAQVIIIENGRQLPGDGTLDGVKVELFTGNTQGRRGFIR